MKWLLVLIYSSKTIVSFVPLREQNMKVVDDACLVFSILPVFWRVITADFHCGEKFAGTAVYIPYFWFQIIVSLQQIWLSSVYSSQPRNNVY